jgi:arsenical pump membrane protein
VTVAIATLAMLLAGFRPKGTREWMWAAGGAALLLLFGLEPAIAAARAIESEWNVLLFFLGLMCIAAAAEEAGAFELVAEALLRRAGGSRRRLFVLLFAAGAALTTVLSNDATAIVFTPIVYRAVVRRGGDALAYLFACTFVADTASFGLPFANPANLIILPRPHVAAYLAHLAVPEIAAIAINGAAFVWIFRSSLRGRYVCESRDEEEAPKPAARRTLLVACCVAVGYLIALAYDLPLGPLAVAGAIVTIAAARVNVVRTMRHVSWSTFVLLGALFVLLDALAHAGFVSWAVHGLETVGRHGTLAAIAAATAGAALLSNVVNNLPVAVAGSHVVAQSPHFAYPLIVGTDLGPNLTTTGSLATILWLAALRRRGVSVSALEYLRLGAVVVPPMLLVSILWLWLVR